MPAPSAATVFLTPPRGNTAGMTLNLRWIMAALVLVAVVVVVVVLLTTGGDGGGGGGGGGGPSY
jgi:hypothetical protein